MSDWAPENETIRQNMIADKFGENGDPSEQVDGYAQVVVQLRTVLAHLTEGESWSLVQNCILSGLDAWRRLHTLL